MPFWEACSKSISHLPELRDLAAAALAINLAYLNLERFRYRSKVRVHARKELERISSGNGAEFAKSQSFQRLKWLAALPNHDVEEAATISAAERKAQWKKIKWPDGIWPKTYLYLFEGHWDRTVSTIAAIIALLALFLGTDHSVGHLTSLSCFFADEWELITLYLLFAGIVLPGLFVCCGRQVVMWGCKFASESVNDIEVHLQAGAQKARLRSGP